jgi:hypothetical protein
VPVPVVDNAHVAEGVGLLTSRYVSAPVVSGLATALMTRFQEAEAQLWSLIQGVQLVNHPMAGGPWSILDQLGALVGVARNGMPDVAYLSAIQLEIRANRSQGLSEDIIQVLTLYTGTSQFYLDVPPASFIVELFDVTGNIPFLASLLTRVRSAATYGELTYTTWSPGNDFELGTTTGSVTFTDGGLGSTTDATVGGLLTSGIGI